MKKLSIDKVDLKNKRVLVRVDFNVPLDENLQITDDIRITSSLPTINKIIKEDGKAILMSHLGRPKGKVNLKYSLKPAAERLSKLLGKEVILSPDCIGEVVKSLVNKMNSGDVLMLENLRFHEEEEKNDEAFANKLSELGDVYVNDAFGSAHRAHASTEGIAKFVLAKEVLEKAKNSNVKFLLPVDFIVADEFKNESPSMVVKADAIPSDKMGLDIGPETIKLFKQELENSKTIVWNGPMGVFEMDNFAKGTFAIAQVLADVTSKNAVTIIGGGDSAAAISKAGLDDKVSHVSTGGGASLKFLEGKVLPGVDALTNA